VNVNVNGVVDAPASMQIVVAQVQTIIGMPTQKTICTPPVVVKSKEHLVRWSIGSKRTFAADFHPFERIVIEDL
jgi:hypothetical protein